MDTNKMDIEEIKKVVEENNLHYRQGNPKISDKEYDSLVEKLKELDPDNEWFSKTEPSPVSSKRKVSLPIPMKSLDKAKDIADLKKWCKSLGLTDRTELIVMPKFDGISLLCDEMSEKTFTRGGKDNEGQDCSSHFKVMDAVYDSINPYYTFGEAIINNEKWKEHFSGKVSDYSGEPFKSPRNTVAGLMNRDDPDANLLQHVSLFRYGVNKGEWNFYQTYEKLFTEICQTFNQPLLYEKIKVCELDESDLMDSFIFWRGIYPIDGLVIYINDLNYWEMIGRHQSTGNPQYAIAYKHPDFSETFETTVKDITWKVSKSGALKPVVNIEPVDTGDCNMENPTGYNASWIYDMYIAKGAKVIVTRSGGVIPKIIRTKTPAEDLDTYQLWDKMAECPSCGSQTVWNQSFVELCCSNPNCPGRQLAKIVFFFDVCKTEEAGEETFAKIFNAGYTTIQDILNITFEELVQIDGFGESTANIILENNKRILGGLDMATLMHASDCFEGIGKTKAQKILDDMSEDDEALCSFYQGWYVPSFMNIENLSKTMVSFLRGVDPFYRFLSETQIPILPPERKKVNTDGMFFGMQICFSGIRDEELENTITNEGGKIVNNVSKNTSFLVVKDVNGTSSKITKAKSLGVKITSIEDFKQSL